MLDLSSRIDSDLWKRALPTAACCCTGLRHVINCRRDSFAQGDLSNEAWKACAQLASLEPAEGLGVMAWVVQRIAACAPQGSAHVVAPWIEGLASFAQQCSQQCRLAKGSDLRDHGA